MSDLLIPMISAAITATLVMHLVVMSVQFSHLVMDGIRFRALPRPMSLAALWQNLGVSCALLGLLMMDSGLTVVGLLFIALRLLLQPLRAPSWDRRAELPLLIGAGCTLGALAVTHIVPRVLSAL